MNMTDAQLTKKVPGDFAWIVLVSGIVMYDVAAVFSGKAETLSSALWRSLSHPVKSPLTAMLWVGVTWHLFANKEARASYRCYAPYIQNITVKISSKGNQ